jgi:hypothetical protein
LMLSCEKQLSIFNHRHWLFIYIYLCILYSWWLSKVKTQRCNSQLDSSSPGSWVLKDTLPKHSQFGNQRRRPPWSFQRGYLLLNNLTRWFRYSDLHLEETSSGIFSVFIWMAVNHSHLSTLLSSVLHLLEFRVVDFKGAPEVDNINSTLL